MSANRKSWVSAFWSPACELFASFGAFSDRNDTPTIDLGAEWVRRVRQQVAPAFVREAAQTMTREGKQMHQVLAPLLLDRSTGDAEAFLDFLAGLSVGELYERVAPSAPDGGPGLPRDVGAARDRYVRLLRTWHEGYFRGVDPEVLERLAAERDALAARIGTLPDLDLVEQATHGIRLEPPIADFPVVLVPQYHYRPLNQTVFLHEQSVICYPADVLPTPPGDPPASLRRLASALADPSRLRILRTLADGARSLTQIARDVGLSQSTVHHHLAALRAAGLTRTHYSSGTNRYSLRSGAVDQLGAELRAFLAPDGA